MTDYDSSKTGNVCINVTEARSGNLRYRRKAIIIRQSACAVLYCHMWPLWLLQIFPHYLIKDAILGKKFLNIKCVF
jgi:hypothetical protein